MAENHPEINVFEAGATTAVADARAEAARLNRAARGELNRLNFDPEREELEALARDLHGADALSAAARDVALLALETHTHREGRAVVFTNLRRDAAGALAERAVRWMRALHGAEAVIELAALPTKGGSGAPAFALHPGREGEAHAWIATRITEGWNIYFGARPRLAAYVGTRSGTGDDVASYPLGFLDFDRADGESRKAFDSRMAGLFEKLNAHRPVAAVDTGGGRHVWFRLASTTDRAEMDRRAKVWNALAARLGSDAMGDLRRIARLPFTINTPSPGKRAKGRKIALVRAEPPDGTAPAYDFGLLVGALSGKAAQGAVVVASPIDTAPGPAPINADLAPGGDDEARAANLRRVLALIPNRGGRFDAYNDALVVVASIVRAGKGSDEAEALAQEWLGSWDGPVDPERDKKMVASIKPGDRPDGPAWTHLLRLAKACSPNAPDLTALRREEAAEGHSGAGKAKGRASEVDKAVAAFVDAGCEAWRDRQDEAHVTLKWSNGVGTHHDLNTRAGKRTLVGWLQATKGLALSKDKMAEFIGRLEARAATGPRYDTAARIARDGDVIRFDFGRDHDVTGVIIEPGSWRTGDISLGPTRLVRTDGMEPCSDPAGGVGAAELPRVLGDHINLPALPANLAAAIPDDPGVRAVAALLAFFAGVFGTAAGAKPILALTGPAGSGKSTAGKYLAELIDPNGRAVTGAPRDEVHLSALVRGAPMRVLDNLSKIDERLADAICRVSTGDAYTARRQYTDGDVVAWQLHASLILASIAGEVLTREDIADRSVVLALALPDIQRRESDAAAAWSAAIPRIRGALFDVVAGGLALLPAVGNAAPPCVGPRFADAALFAEAMARACGWPDWLCWRALVDGRDEARADRLAADPLVLKLEAVLDARNGTHTAPISEWLDLLNATPPHWGRSGGPQTPRALRAALDRLAGDLSRIGITMKHGHEGRGERKQRVTTITRAGGARHGADRDHGPVSPF